MDDNCVVFSGYNCHIIQQVAYLKGGGAPAQKSEKVPIKLRMPKHKNYVKSL